MWLLILTLACQEELGRDWVGVCSVEGHDLDVELHFSEQAWDILSGDVTLSEGSTSGESNFHGSRSADDLEFEFVFGVDGYVWDGLWVGQIDGNDMEATVRFMGSEYETEGPCLLEED